MRLVLTLLVSSTVFALPRYIKPFDGYKVEYQKRYESDSGYADINDCARTIYDHQGRKIAWAIVHDFNDREANVFCAGLQAGERRTYVLWTESDSGYEDRAECYNQATGSAVPLKYCAR